MLEVLPLFPLEPDSYGDPIKSMHAQIAIQVQLEVLRGYRVKIYSDAEAVSSGCFVVRTLCTDDASIFKGKLSN